MKKTAAILASIAALSLCTTSAFAANGDNIVDGVLNGAEDVVDGVISGAEEIITPGGSTGAVSGFPVQQLDRNVASPAPAAPMFSPQGRKTAHRQSTNSKN